MDKETLRELERLKARGTASEKRLEDLEEAKRTWDSLVKDTIIKAIKFLIAIATTGLIFGWNMPENIRKALSEWIAK